MTLAKAPKQKPKEYPSIFCDNCSAKVQLKLNPRIAQGFKDLKKLKCPECKKLVYDDDLRQELSDEKIRANTKTDY